MNFLIYAICYLAIAIIFYLIERYSSTTGSHKNEQILVGVFWPIAVIVFCIGKAYNLLSSRQR